MVWRLTEYLIAGELDNTTPGKVTGWMRFAGLKEKVTFDLKGNFHRDIRGAKIRLRGGDCEDDQEAASYMVGFATHQTGKVGDMTAGRPPQDYCAYPYYEWYGDDNGHVVIELDPEQVEVIGRSIAPVQGLVSDPSFTHWVVVEGHVIGEARDVEPGRNGMCFAYVRFFNMPEYAEHSITQRELLREKADGLPNDAATADEPILLLPAWFGAT